MKVLLTFLFVIYIVAIRAAWRGRTSRAWWVLAGSFLLASALYYRRFI